MSAEVPREVVEFARMLVRAFHPPEFVVAVDGVLRGNNFIAHHNLAKRLKWGAKDLRVVMVRLVAAGLMKADKHSQKKTNEHDDRRTQKVTTEFWYVPLRQMVDAFVYRVHRITSELDATIVKATQDRVYICMRCKKEYSEVELPEHWNEEANDFICLVFGNTGSRRLGYCAGKIAEQDTAGGLQDAEALKSRFESQLKPLREIAQKCAAMYIPAHPMEGATHEDWEAIAPQEVVDESTDVLGGDTYLPQVSDRPAKAAEPVQEQAPEIVAPPKQDDAPIPEKPLWFQENGAGEDDNEEDWDDSKTLQNVVKGSTGTAASFEAIDVEKYYQQATLEEDNADGKGDGDADKGEKAEVIEMDEDEDLDDEDAEEIYVKVAGRDVKLSDVNDDMIQEMTNEEHAVYFAAASRNNGDDDDDDDEFE